MCQVAVDIPEAVLYNTQMTATDAVAFVKRAAAVEYYRSRQVPLGYCAQIAGMAKADFIRYLGSKKISIFHFANDAELENEVENA